MKSFRSMLLPIVVGLTIASSAQAQPEPGPSIFKSLEQLALNEQQRQDIRTLLRQWQEDREVVASKRAHRERIRAFIQASQWDEQAVLEVLEQGQPAHQAQRWATAQLREAIWQTLTEQQRAQWLTMHEESEQRHAPEPLNGQWLEKLELSPQQLQELDELRASANAIKEQESALRQAFAEAEITLIEQDNLTESQWLAVYSEYPSQFDALAVEKLYQRHRFYHLLNETQRVVFAKLKRKREHQHRVESKPHKPR